GSQAASYDRRGRTIDHVDGPAAAARHTVRSASYAADVVLARALLDAWVSLDMLRARLSDLLPRHWPGRRDQRAAGDVPGADQRHRAGYRPARRAPGDPPDRRHGGDLH